MAGVSKDPEANIDEEGNKSSVGEAIDFLKNVLDPAIIKIEENLGKILGNLEGKVESDKDKAEDLRQSQDAAADDAREAKLEIRGGKSKQKQQCTYNGKHPYWRNQPKATTEHNQANQTAHINNNTSHRLCAHAVTIPLELYTDS